MTKLQQVSVVGLGYIGLPTAAVLADSGLNVHGVEIKQETVDLINRGGAHILEQGLGDLVSRVVKSGNLRADTQPIPAEVHIIAVPTPITETKEPDLSYLRSAVRTVCTVLRRGNLVVIESTSPPRTCQDVVGPLIEDLTGMSHESDFDLAYCPERVIPGNILNEIVQNDRVVGGTTTRATERTADLYSTFVKGQLLQTDATTAEMCKLMENTYRDVNIALANQLAGLANKLGVNINDAIRLANHHPRVNIHRPGIGVGGHCIPVDPWFLLNGDFDGGKLIKQARHINDEQPAAVATAILDELNRMEPEYNLPIIFLGLTYKPDTDDFRESPAISIAKRVGSVLTDRPLYVFDPFLTHIPKELADLGVRLADPQDLQKQPGIIIELVPHTAFQSTVLHEDSLVMKYENDWQLFHAFDRSTNLASSLSGGGV